MSLKSLLASTGPLTMPTRAAPKIDYKDMQFEQGEVLPLIAETDPLLNLPSKAWEFDDEAVTEQLYFNLVNTMRANNGMGLSAIQVGIPARVFVMETGEEYPLAVFNPKIVESEGEVILEEGCLSFPKIAVKVKRAKSVTIRFQLIDGSWKTMSFTGMTARCVLHEIDHLNGITMKQRANKIHWQAAAKKRKQFK